MRLRRRRKRSADPILETARARAAHDFWPAVTGSGRAWAFLAITGLGGIALGIYLSWDHGRAGTAVWSVVGAALALLAGLSFLFGALLATAPLRQRNEVRGVLRQMSEAPAAPAAGIGLHDLGLTSVGCALSLSKDPAGMARAAPFLVFSNGGSVKLRWEVREISAALGATGYERKHADGAYWKGVIFPGGTGEFHLPALMDVSTDADPIIGELDITIRYGDIAMPLRFETRKRLRLELRRRPDEKHPSGTHFEYIAADEQELALPPKLSELVGFLREKRAELPAMIDACPELGREARALGDDWASPITARLVAFNPKLATIFNDDGDVRYTSSNPEGFFRRRQEQIQKVIEGLESVGE